MRIAYLITRSDIVGGINVHVRDMALAVRARGHTATVITGRRGPFCEQLDEHGIPYVVIPHLRRPISPVKDVLSIAALRRVIDDLRPDLISAHSAKAHLMGRIVGSEHGIPVIATAHGWSFTTGVPPFRARIYRRLERLAVRGVRRVITVSDYDRRLGLRAGVVCVNQVVTVHNGMPAIDERLMSDPGVSPPRLVMVARFEEQKDHSTLLQALAGLTHLEWELELIGEGPGLGQTRALVAELGLTPRVSFLGARRDVAERLAQAQVFFLITKWEGFPRSILEAMRAGLPVVASDVGGVSESVHDGVTGFVVPRGDVAYLRNRIATLVADRELRARLGAAGRDRFLSQFTFDRMFDKTVGLYRDVLRESSAADQPSRESAAAAA